MQGKTPTFLGELINLHAERLTQADRRLLEVLVRDPIQAAMESGTDVSFRAGVHPASAVRLARRLGFKGYPEFRTFLQKKLVDGHGEFEDPTARITARIALAEEGGLLASVIDSERAALQSLRQSVTDDNIRPFSTAILRARRIYLLGTSHASALCVLLALRLRRSGYDAIDLSTQQHQHLEQLAGIGSQDVLWLINFRQAPAIVTEVHRIAGEVGAKVLALTNQRGARLFPPPDHGIVIPRHGAGESQSLIAALAVANTVILDLATIDEGRTVRALAAFRDRRDTREQ